MEAHRFVPTDEQRALVTKLRQEGLSYDEIRMQVRNMHGRPISVNTLMRYFKREIGAQQGRYRRYERRVRVVEKPKGWTPLHGSKLSHGDCIAIIASSASDDSLAHLYGVTREEIGKVKRGQLRALRHSLPALRINLDGDDPLTIRRRFQAQRMLLKDLLSSLEQLIWDFTEKRLKERNGKG